MGVFQAEKVLVSQSAFQKRASLTLDEKCYGCPGCRMHIGIGQSTVALDLSLSIPVGAFAFFLCAATQIEQTGFRGFSVYQWYL